MCLDVSTDHDRLGRGGAVVIVPAGARQRRGVLARGGNIVWIPGGTFQMGSSRRDPEGRSEHCVAVTAPREVWSRRCARR